MGSRPRLTDRRARGGGPDRRDDHAALGASLAEVQWVVDAYALAPAAVLLPAGVLADRYGRRRMLTVGVTVFTVASLAPSPAWR
ncbi:MFS transporter [Nonomuraea sp. NPDC049758]|uniref:MFS transporter n=1 Tax=Nonomuraea sp. NPDC049758 TaxID=3154360 RepID=UPI00342BD18D